MATAKMVSADNKRRTRKRRTRLDKSALASVCQKVLGSRLIQVTYPGGKSRKACRVHLADGRTAIATMRRSGRRQEMEKMVLAELSGANVRVPSILGYDDRVVFQEDVGNQRFTEALQSNCVKDRYVWLEKGVLSLAELHGAASDSGLDVTVPPIGHSRSWRQQLIDRPAVIGSFIDTPAPVPDLVYLRELLAVRRARFIKWDARPGNAVIDMSGSVVWIDWEHAGSRNRLDDLVWLLGDEYLEDDESLEWRLLDSHIDRFADGLSRDESLEYFYGFGVFHSCVRLGLILHYKKNDDWWDYAKCLKGDKAGVALNAALRLCSRGRRWAAAYPATRVLAPWFSQTAARLRRI